MSDLVTNVLRTAHERERRNRELNLACFIILVALGIATSALAYLWFSALLAALLTITSFGLAWYALRPGLKSLNVTTVDIAQLVDRALPTKDRAATLTNLGDGPTPFERASRELIQTQLHQVLSAACAERSIQTSPIERCVAALQIAPLILSACAKRSLIFAAVLLFVVGLLVTLRPIPPLEQLADELRAAINQTPNLPQTLREKMEAFADSLASTAPADGGATQELMNTTRELRSEITQSALSSSGDSTTINQSPQISESQRPPISPQQKEALKGAPSQQPAQSEKQGAPEREKEQAKEETRPEENHQGEKQPKDSPPQDSKKESEPSAQTDKNEKQDGKKEGSGTQQNGSSSGSSQQKDTQQKAQNSSSQGGKQESNSQQSSQQSGGGSSGNGSQGSGGQGSSQQGNDQSNDGSSAKTGGSGSSGSQGGSKSDDTSGDGKNSQRGSKGDAPHSSSKGESAHGMNGSQKDSDKQDGGSPQKQGAQQQGAHQQGAQQPGTGQSLQQVMQKIDQQLQEMHSAETGGSGSGSRGEQPGQDGDSPQGDGDSKDSQNSSQSKGKQGGDGKKPGSEKGENKKEGASPRDPSQGSGKQQGKSDSSEDSAENNSPPPHDPQNQNPRDGSAKGSGQRSGQPQEPKGIREVAGTGKDPSGVGDPALDTQRELLKGSNEQLDLRFTDKNSSIEKNNQPAVPKTTIEEMQLDKPRGTKERGEQPIPLEYRDMLR